MRNTHEMLLCWEEYTVHCVGAILPITDIDIDSSGECGVLAYELDDDAPPLLISGQPVRGLSMLYKLADVTGEKRGGNLWIN